MPPVPYCAENSESLIFTSAMVSKIGVLMTLLLIGELVDAPSSSALENGMLPFTDTPPIPGLLLLVAVAARARQERKERLPVRSSAGLRQGLQSLLRHGLGDFGGGGFKQGRRRFLNHDCLRGLPDGQLHVQTGDAGGQRHGSALQRGEAFFLEGDQVAVGRDERAGVVHAGRRS